MVTVDGRVNMHGSVGLRRAFPVPSPVPSDEPPAGVASELVWRLAMRLYQDHAPAPPRVIMKASPGPLPLGGSAREADWELASAPATCAGCGQPWPCSGRRLAELGLNEAIVRPDR